MASVFKRLGNFLKKDEARIGLGALGAVAGLGGFEGMRYGDALTKGIGGLNIASGVSAGGTSGALQAGLGGYNLAQGFGKVGTFQDSYRSIFGGGQTAPQQITQESNAALPNFKTEISANNPLNTEIQAYRDAGFDDEEILARIRNKQATTDFSPDGLKTKMSPVNPMVPPIGGASAFANAGQVNSGTYGGARPDALNAQNFESTLAQNMVTQPGTNPGAALPADTLARSGIEPGSVLDQKQDVLAATMDSNANRITGMNTGGFTTVTAENGKQANAFYDMLSQRQLVQDENGFIVDASKWAEKNALDKPFSFEGLFDNVVQKAMDDPLQAFSIGSALATSFMESPQEQAAREYAESVARIRAETDPNSDFGQTFQATYTQQRQDELDKQYTQAKADLTNSLAKRGMQDSTLATEQMASLNAKYAELQSKLPMDAMMALQTYQNARFKNIAAGTAPAATAAKLAASQQSPFSLASKGAVSSVGS